MPRLDRLPEASRKGLLALPVQANDTAPFVRPARPLASSRLALVTTAGLHRRTDRLFEPGEQGFRVLPSDTLAADILQSHTSIGFDRAAILRDLNVTFPIDRVRELVGQGRLGGLARNGYSFMGALRDVAKLESESGPEVAGRLREDGADVALLTPT
jgi:D-proline reductase (dithiol) PrdB